MFKERANRSPLVNDVEHHVHVVVISGLKGGQPNYGQHNYSYNYCRKRVFINGRCYEFSLYYRSRDWMNKVAVTLPLMTVLYSATKGYSLLWLGSGPILNYSLLLHLKSDEIKMPTNFTSQSCNNFSIDNNLLKSFDLITSKVYLQTPT